MKFCISLISQKAFTNAICKNADQLEQSSLSYYLTFSVKVVALFSKDNER